VAGVLLPAEAVVEVDVLGHRLVRAQAQLGALPAAGLLVCEAQQPAAETLPLPVGVDGDVLDQEVIALGPKDDDPKDFVFHEHEDLAGRDKAVVVGVHRRGAATDPRHVSPVGALRRDSRRP
jgi:hypothetical protein